MKNSIFIYLMLICLALLATNVLISEARGGRRGGSFGGIFGGWRKYNKKPTSAGSSRRTNGSPMHTTATKSISSGSLASAKPLKQTKAQSSYPKQQVPMNQPYGNGHGSFYNGGSASATYVPPGATYYANTAAMPAGAIYYAQSPTRTSGNGNFLFGMMAGHVMSNALFGHRPYVTHVYHQNAPQQQGQAQLDNGKVIIINANADGSNAANATGNLGESTHFWPTDAEVPLAEFNTSITPAESLKPGNNIIFPRIYNSNNSVTNSENIEFNLNTQPAITQVHEQHGATVHVQEQQQPPIGSIVCVPVLFNETDPHDPSKIQHVEKVICFPAPAVASSSTASAAATAASSPLQQQQQASSALSPNTICFKHTIIERDPNDATKTITIEKEDCSIVATTQPPQVAGEIGENAANETTHTSSTADLQLSTDTATRTSYT